MTTSNNLPSYPPFFRANQGVDNCHRPVEDLPESGSDSPDSSQSSELDSLPVMDYRALNPAYLTQVCREWGMFRLTNHGVPVELLTQLHEHASKIFSLSFESKQELPTNPILYFWGSPAITMSGNAKQSGPSHHINWLEGLNVSLSEISHSHFQDHHLLESFRSLLEEYGGHQTRLAKAIFNILSQYLNFPSHKSTSYLSPPTGILRVYRYLRCPGPEQRWGISPHTDSSVLSIIHQDQVGGLQVFKDGEWMDVKPVYDTFIVNLGDMMQSTKSEKMMFESSQSNSPAGGGAGFISSQSADPSPTSAKNRDAQPMYPVTVKQIMEASASADDKSIFLIDGIVVYNVKLVGMVSDKSARVTDISFVLDDGTGRIGCNRWVNDSYDTQEAEELIDGIYVRVHGHLRNSQGNKQVVVYAIRPVKDYNEIANHFLECAHAHCCNTKSQNNGSATFASSTATTNSGPTAVSSSQVSQEYNLDGLGNIDKMVLDYLALPSSLAQEKGIHRNEIAQKLKISQEKIIEAMESLESEGLVYSTIDEFHYKSTAS